MALRMAQPWSHPKTGIFWFRRAVPQGLRVLVGKREELLTLRTKDAAEARVRYASASAEVEARWANLRGGTHLLTEREAHALAAKAHNTWLEWHGDGPSRQFTWIRRLYRDLWTRPFPADLVNGGSSVAFDDVVLQNMRRFCLVQAI